MDTLVGRTLAHYRVERELARGGMGVVYLARDTRLDRPVALKSLPEDFASDPDRLVRFEREAKALASLSHPNVAGIYGVEVSEGRRYLALEYIEGESLAERLARSPLPIDETIDICFQIASGIEAAHEGGIIHRDLKPGNVMITPGDQVKVVDFGLAKGKVVEREAGSSESPTVTDSPALHHSPTMGTPATLPGVILGTAAYLSPEQARGKAVDRRTDIWSFGCVLYECLTGQRAFVGETVSDLIAKILQGEVEWSRLPKSTPLRLRELMKRCLEKDPRKRLRDMGDARLALEEVREGIGTGESAPAPRLLSPRAAAITVLLLLLGAIGGIALWSAVGPGHRTSSALLGVTRTTFEIPPELEVIGGSISRDGRFLIVAGRPRQREGEPLASLRLYRRRMDSFNFEAIEGSEGLSSLQFAPDGRWLHFMRTISEGATDLCLMKTLLDGSAAPVTVTNWDTSWNSSSWMPLSNGDVLVGTGGGAAYVRVSASGTAASAPIKFAAPGFSGRLQFCCVLPGDRGALLNAVSYEGGRWQHGVGILDLRSGKTRILLRDGGYAAYSPTGHLVFTRGSTLLAVPFDLKSLEIRGEPVAIAEGLRTDTSSEQGLFSLSGNGTLVYQLGGLVGFRRHLIVVDGQGRVSDWTRDRSAHNGTPSVSPDGHRVAYALTNAKGLDEIWISERGGASKRRVAAMQGADCAWPVLSPDGKQIAFLRLGYDRDDGVYVQAVDGGTPTRICRSSGDTLYFVPTSWSPDSRDLLAAAYGKGVGDIVRIAASSAGDSLPPPVPLLSGPADQGVAQFSPDGRWVAYCSNETGKNEVYVAPYRPDGSLGTPLSVGGGGGGGVRWSRSGREVFFYQGLGFSPRIRVVSVSLKYQPVLSASAPVPRWDLDSLRIAGSAWDISPGDQLILVQKGEDESETEITQLACVFNFFDELRQKLRAAGKQ